LILPAVERNAVNRLERRRAHELALRANRLFGLRTWERAAGLATVCLSLIWKLRVALRGDRIQPRTIVTRYRRRPRRLSSPARHPDTTEIAVRLESQMAIPRG